MDAVPDFEEMRRRILSAKPGEGIEYAWGPATWETFNKWRAENHPEDFAEVIACPFWEDGEHAWMIGYDNLRICKECHCGAQVNAK